MPGAHAVDRRSAKKRPEPPRGARVVDDLEPGAVLAELTIFGAPRTKKNHSRIVGTKTGRPFLIPSVQFVAYEQNALWQLKTWRQPALSGKFACCALFFCDRDAGDLLNYEQGLADILQRAFVIVDDRMIRSWDGSDMLVDRENPRVELVLRVR